MAYEGGAERREQANVGVEEFDRVTDGETVQSGLAALVKRFAELKEEEYVAEVLALYRRAGLVLTEREYRAHINRRLREEMAAFPCQKEA